MIVVSRLCYRGTACVARQWCPHVLWRRSRVSVTSYWSIVRLLQVPCCMVTESINAFRVISHKRLTYHLKSLANQLFFNNFRLATVKQKSVFRPFLRIILYWPVDSLHNGLYCRKCFHAIWSWYEHRQKTYVADNVVSINDYHSTFFCHSAWNLLSNISTLLLFLFAILYFLPGFMTSSSTWLKKYK